MATRADLIGHQILGWLVVAKAPAQNRVAFWTAKHDGCGATTDLAHVALLRASEGKGALPPCLLCSPMAAEVSHGMHLACGSAHMVGTPCVVSDCTIVEGRHMMRGPVQLNLSLDDEIPGQLQFDSTDAVSVIALDLDSQQDEPSELPTHDTSAVVGRVDRLDAPQGVLDVIRAAMAGRARNHQGRPGPSQIGGCERRLGYHLAFGQGNRLGADDKAWRPEVGTAVHAWLGEMFAAQDRHTLHRRWLTDYQVTTPVAGTLDLYDVERRRVIDFKVTGKTTADAAARGKIAEKYQVQLDLYALGMINDGFPVDSVALLFLPAAGSLAEAVWYERPVDLERARAAAAKLQRIEALLADVGPAGALVQLTLTSDFCSSCPALGTHCLGAGPAFAPALTISS